MNNHAIKLEEVYTLFVIGSGGTGTALLPNLTRMLATSKCFDKIAAMYLVDGDKVEKKNIGRQNFILDDIGSSKSITYADILNYGLINQIIPETEKKNVTHWTGINTYITSLDELNYFLSESDFYNPEESCIGIPLIIGAVDNDHCRFLCESFFEQACNCFYYDAGNEFSSGEVVFAHKLMNKVLSPCKSYWFPIMKRQEGLKAVTEMSCEELNAVHPQHLVTNMGSAWHLMCGIEKLFADNESSLLDRIRPNLGYVSFDKDAHISEFIAYRPDGTSRTA